MYFYFQEAFEKKHHGTGTEDENQLKSNISNYWSLTRILIIFGLVVGANVFLFSSASTSRQTASEEISFSGKRVEAKQMIGQLILCLTRCLDSS